jgi:large subunit ribosomal protein L1
MEHILDDIRKRRRRRQRKWKRNAAKQASSSDVQEAAATEEKTHLDETIELAINLNVDPRKPGQALRGSITLPNGTGKQFQCIVFTDQDDLAQAALAKGVKYAGGAQLMDDILAGNVPLDTLDRAVGTTGEVMNLLSKKGVARLLGPRKLMPNAKNGTLVTASELLDTVENQMAGKEVLYRTEREGVVHVPIGKASFGVPKLLENAGAVMTEIYAVKPEQYGRGKKSNKKGPVGKGTKYLLKAYMSSTQGPSFLLDPRTVDPNSPFFLTSVDTGPQKKEDTSIPPEGNEGGEEAAEAGTMQAA